MFPTPSPAFSVERQSDFDVFLVSPELMYSDCLADLNAKALMGTPHNKTVSVVVEQVHNHLTWVSKENEQGVTVKSTKDGVVDDTCHSRNTKLHPLRDVVSFRPRHSHSACSTTYSTVLGYLLASVSLRQ